MGYFRYMATGSTFKEITLDALRRTPVLLPPFAEQQAICDALSKRASRIDALIDKTEFVSLCEKNAALPSLLLPLPAKSIREEIT